MSLPCLFSVLAERNQNRGRVSCGRGRSQQALSAVSPAFMVDGACKIYAINQSINRIQNILYCQLTYEFCFIMEGVILGRDPSISFQAQPTCAAACHNSPVPKQIYISFPLLWSTNQMMTHSIPHFYQAGIWWAWYDIRHPRGKRLGSRGSLPCACRIVTICRHDSYIFRNMRQVHLSWETSLQLFWFISEST